MVGIFGEFVLEVVMRKVINDNLSVNVIVLVNILCDMGNGFFKYWILIIIVVEYSCRVYEYYK